MRDEIDQLRAFRADEPDPGAAAWTRAEQAIAEARRQARGRRLTWRLPRTRMLTALAAVPVLAAVVLITVTLSAAPTASTGKTTGAGQATGPAATPLSWSLAGYLVPKGWRLNTHGPVPGALTCPTAKTCYVQGEVTGSSVFGSLYVSTDGARTWRDLPLPGGLTFTTSLVCQTAGACSAGGLDHGASAFTVTRDGGRTWTTNPLPAGTGEITSLSCPAVTTCRALTSVGDSLLAQHLVTTDDGRHFTVTSFPAADGVYLLSCPTASRCLAAGLDTDSASPVTGVVLVSDDDGATWRPGTLPRGVRPGASPIDCVDVEHCFWIGLRIGKLRYLTVHGRRVPVGRMVYSEVMASDDGGATWTPRPLPARYPIPVIDNLACVSVSTCYITGSDSVVQSFDNGKARSGSTPFAAITQDAGQTWQAMSMPEPSSLPPGEPPDVFMSVSSLQCPQLNICIALADNVLGNKYAAIYTTAR